MRVVISNFKGLDFKSDNSVLNLQTKNTQIRHFWSQIQAFFSAKFSSQENLIVLTSNMTMLFSNFCPEIPKSSIFVPKFKLFFNQNFAIRQIQRVLISNMTISFQIQVPKYPKQEFLVPNLVFFFLLQNFGNGQISGC